MPFGGVTVLGLVEDAKVTEIWYPERNRFHWHVG
jgi:hypothetical protein